MKKNYFKILLLLFALSATLFAQSFELTTDQTRVGQNQRFQVYFTFKGKSASGLKNFNPPGFNGFKVLSGPNQSTSMQIINGSVNSKVTFSYILVAPDLGTFKINPARVEYDGKTFTSNDLTIKVVKGSPKQKTQQNQGVSTKELAKNVFIRAIPDKKNVYQGEQVTVTYKLYTRLNLASLQVSKLPTFNGFWQEELESSNTINWDVEMYNGQRFRSAVIKRVALFPTKTGELTVTPFELDVPVLVKRKRQSSDDFFNDFFNDSFFGRTETIDFTAKSNTVKINSKPLPAGAPDSFNGAVGNFNLKTDIDKTSLKTNESLNIKFTVSGTGNIQLLDLPKLELPAGFEVYEPKSNVDIKRGSRISGSKTFDYLVVPRVAGVKKIKPLVFTYFNPAKRKYITLKSPEYTLNIKQGAASEQSVSNGFSKQDVKLLNEDIRFIKTSDFELTKKTDRDLIKFWFWLGLIIPALILGSVIALRKRQEKLSGNVQLMKYRKAEKAARSRLKTAKKLLEENKSQEFYSEISFAMNGYLEDKLNIQKSDFTLDKALNKLSENNIANELKGKVKEIYERCEFARFAPSSEGMKAEQTLYDDTINVIIKIEHQLNNKKK